MNPLQSSCRGQLAQVASDRVLGNVPLHSEIFRNYLSVLSQAGEDQLLSLCGKQCRNRADDDAEVYTSLHESARTGTLPAMPATPPMLVMICGPYTSGTGGDPNRIAANRERLESFALPIYEKGHLPVIGEWLALPIVRAAGGREVAEEVFGKYQYPVAHRLLQRCDAVLRIAGESKGADLDVQRARELGLRVFSDLAEIPVRREGP